LLTCWATRSQSSSRPAWRYAHMAAFAARASGDEPRAPDLTATACATRGRAELSFGRLAAHTASPQLPACSLLLS
jgi:hypothetical protein